MKSSLLSMAILLSLFSCSKDSRPPVVSTGNGKSIVVLDGDSRTDGWNCEGVYPYMNLLDLVEPCLVYKTSFGGLNTADLISRAQEFVDSKYSAEARHNILVVWIGVNDMAFKHRSAAKTFNNLKSYCLERLSKGWRVIVCTEVSMKGRGIFGEYDRIRKTYNDLIIRHAPEFADGIADLAANNQIGSYGAHLDSTHFCDGIHLTNAGTEIVGKIINEAIDLALTDNR